MTKAQIEVLVELEKKAAEAPWLVQDDSKTVISCMTTNDGKPYLGFVAGVGHYDTRDFIIALRNAAPDLFRLALRGLAAEKVVEAARELNANSTEPDDVSTDDYGNMIRSKWKSLSQVLAELDKEGK